MPNRISGYKPTGTPERVTGGNLQGVDKTPSEATTASATGSSAAADQVTLTGSARTLQKLGEAIANAPVVNTQKVAVVKQAVQNGTYQVDAGSIADKILQLESGLK